MKPHPIRLVSAFALSLCAVAGASAADNLDPSQGRMLVAPFYEALNAAPGKDVGAMIGQATGADWVSCGANDVCAPRDKVISGISGFHKAIPDLKWEIKELIVSGNQIIVRGEASGTPAGAFMGVPHGGKSFQIMSIDIHTIDSGKIVRSHHVEDWIGATRQMSGK
jgi:hypothetical protein